jgi:hypothetical protein
MVALGLLAGSFVVVWYLLWLLCPYECSVLWDLSWNMFWYLWWNIVWGNIWPAAAGCFLVVCWLFSACVLVGCDLLWLLCSSE